MKMICGIDCAGFNWKERGKGCGHISCMDIQTAIVLFKTADVFSAIGTKVKTII